MIAGFSDIRLCGIRRWWYDRGMPERRIGKKPARWIDSDTPVMYLRCGDQWVLQDYAGVQPSEAEIAAYRFLTDA